nr:glycosyltransferase [Paludibacterium yongneupense]
MPSSCLHVAFGIDARYVRGMAVTIASIVANNPDRDFVFHVFYGSIAEADFDRLDALARKLATTIILNLIDKTIFAGLATFGQYTHAIYNRLVISDNMKGVTPRILYLDADIVCLGDVSELAEMDLGDNIVAAVADVGRVADVQSAKLNLEHGRYFNSGMILIDIERWNAGGISNKALSILSARKSDLSFPDQDALNIALDGRVAIVDRKWNRLYDLGVMNEDIAAETVFLHYAAGTKPWFSWSFHPLKSHFMRYYSQSPWGGLPLDPPRDYKEMRALARGLIRQRCYCTGLGWYLRSLRKRLAKKFGCV